MRILLVFLFCVVLSSCVGDEGLPTDGGTVDAGVADGGMSVNEEIRIPEGSGPETIGL